MKKSKKNALLVLVFLLFHHPSYASEYPIISQDVSPILLHGQPISVCITIPKSGTHLLLKCLSLFKIKGFKSHDQKGVTNQTKLDKIRAKNLLPPPFHYKGKYHLNKYDAPPLHNLRNARSLFRKLFWTHWPHYPWFDAYVSQHTTADFLMIRDPRDMVVSFAHMVYKQDNQEKPFEKVLLDLIDGRKSCYIPWGVEIHQAYPLIWEMGVANFYKLYLPWMKNKKFYTVKFENLVGPKGGGTQALQDKEIDSIAQHLGVKLSPAHKNQIINEVFGGTWTFREGAIGGWKKYFTPECKAAYKGKAGANKLLIDLGYETNDAW